MNNFEICSNLERERIIQFFKKTGIKDYQLTDSFGFAKHDCIFGDCITEVKVREFRHNDWCDWILEYKKYQYLMSQPFKGKIYLNFYTDNTVRYWKLHQLQLEWFMKLLPANTAGGGRDIMKKICLLDNNQGKLIRM